MASPPPTNTMILPAPAPGTIRDILQIPSVRARFEEVLQERAMPFLASLASLVYANPNLKDCEPESFITAALTAASLDLSPDPHLGFAWLIPYMDNRSGGKRAQFQMGYKGYIQLAMRTGQYRLLNVTEIYYGQIKSFNRLSGEYIFGEPESETIVGYAAYLKLNNGYEKTIYMTVEELHKHGARYSKSYGKETSLWKMNFPAMALKTVLKQLLTKWGVLSVEMQQALAAEIILEEEAEELPLDLEQRAQDKAAVFPDGESLKPLAEDEILFCGKAVKKKERISNLINTDYKAWFTEHVFKKFDSRKHYENHLQFHFGVHSASNLTYEMLVAMANHLNEDKPYPEQWQGEKEEEDKVKSLGLERLLEDNRAKGLSPETLRPILDKIIGLVENKTFDPNTLDGATDIREVFKQELDSLAVTGK